MAALSLKQFKSRRMGKRGARKNRAAAQGNFLMELTDLPFRGSATTMAETFRRKKVSSLRRIFFSFLPWA
jgi:hypothetical protein